MSILDRGRRWGGWFDRLVAVRDSHGTTTVISDLASEICNIEDQVDQLKEQNADLIRSLEAEVWAREVRNRFNTLLGS